MAETVDELKIKVEAEAKTAASSIEDLSNKLKDLQQSVAQLDVNKINDLNTALQGLSNLKLGSSSKDIKSLNKDIDNLTKTAGKNLSDDLINSFNIADKKIQSSVKSMSNEITRLNRDMALKDAEGSIEKIDEVWEDLQNTVEKGFNADVDGSLKDFYDNFTSLKPIYLSDLIVNDMQPEEWTSILRQFPGQFTTNLGKSSTGFDSLYQEMSEQWPNLAPESITNIQDEFRQVIDVVNQYKAALHDTSQEEEEVGSIADQVGDKIRNAFNNQQSAYAERLGAPDARQSNLTTAYNQQTDTSTESDFTKSVDLMDQLSKAMNKVPDGEKLSTLSGNLESLGEASRGLTDLSTIADGLNNLSEAVNKMPSTSKFENFSKNLSALSKNTNVDNLPSIARSLRAFNEEADKTPEVFGVQIDASGFEKLNSETAAALTNYHALADMAKTTTTDFKDFSSKASGGFEEVSQSAENIGDSLNNADEDLMDFSNDASSLNFSPNMFEFNDSGLSDISWIIDMIKGKFEGFKTTASEALNAVSTLFGKLGSAALNVAKGALNVFNNALKKAGSFISSAASKTVTFTKNLAKAALQATPVAKIGDAFNAVGNMADKLNSKISRMVRLFTMMVARTAFRAIFSDLQTSFQELAIYSDDVNARVSSLMSSLSQLSHSITAVAKPILDIFGPALNYIINLMNDAINVVNQFISAFTGKTYVTGTYVASDYAAGLEDAADAASDAADSQAKLNKQLQGFNELNNLTTSEPSSSSGSGGTSGTGGEYTPGYYEELPISQDILDFVDKLKEAWENADFTEIGNIIGEKLKEALESIPWDKIQDTAEKLAHSLGTLINGFVETEGLGETIGNTIGEAIKTALLFADDLLNTIRWDSVGQFLADIMNGAVESIPWDLLGKTLGDSVAAWLETIYNVVTNFHWDELGAGLAEAINNFVDVVNTALTSYDWAECGKNFAKGLNKLISDIDWDNLGKLLANAINTLFSTIGGAIEEFDFASLGKDLATAISNAIENTDFENIGNAIGSLIRGAISFVANLVSGLEISDLVSALEDLFTGILEGINPNFDASGIIESIKGSIDSIYKTIKGITGVKLVLGAILTFAGVSMPLGIALLASGALDLASAVSENWGSIGEKIGSVIAQIEKLVGAGLLAVGAVLLFSGQIPLGLGLLVVGCATLGKSISEDWDSAKNKVAGVLSSIETIVSAALLAIGAVLVFTGAGIPLGLGMILVGAAGLASSIAENLDCIPDKVKKVIEIITTVVEGALLVVGAILAFTGVNLPLGLGLMAVGAVGLGSEIAANWDTIKEKLQGTLGAITAIVSTALLALGVILLLTGAGIPLGLGLIAAGAAGLGATVAANWDSIIGDISSALENVKTTFLNAVSDLKEKAKNAIEIGVGLVKKGWSTLTGWLGDVKDTVVNVAVGLAKKVGGWASDAWEAIKNGGKSFVTTVQTALKKASTWVSDAWDAIKQGGRTVMTTIETALQKAGTWVQDAWDAIKLGGQKVITTVQTALEKASTWVSDAWDAIKLGGQKVVTTVQTALQKANTWVSDAWDAIKQGGKTVVTTVQAAVQKASTWVSDAWTAIKSGGQKLVATVQTAVQKASTWVSDAWTAIKSGGQTAMATVETALKKAGTWVQDAWTAIKSAGQTAVATVQTALKKASTWVSDAWTAIKNAGKTVTDTVQTALKKASSWSQEAWTALKNIGSTVTDTVQTVLKKASSWSSDAWTALSNIGKTVTDTVQTVLKKASSWSSDAWTALKNIGKSLSESVSVALKKNGWSTIANFVGTAVSVGISLFKRGWSTITSFVGNAVSVGVSLVKSGWSSIKSFFGLSSGGILGAGGGVRLFAEGGIITNGMWRSLPKYADGTDNAHGTMFVAGESGAEVVGNINGRTEVLNTSQLAVIMQSAVVGGFAQYVPTWRAIYSQIGTCASEIADAEYESTDMMARTGDRVLSNIEGNHNPFENEDHINADNMSRAVDLLTQIADAMSSGIPVDFQVEGDPNGIFKVTQKQAQEYKNRTGNMAFA